MNFAEYCFAALLAGSSATGALAGDFTLSEKAGSFAVDFRGKPLITASGFTIDGQPVFRPGELAVAKTVLPDGATAFNVWSRAPERRYRQEAVVSADGSRVEINMQFDYQAYSEAEGKTVAYVLQLPYRRLAGREFDAVIGRSNRTQEVHGKVPEAFGNFTADRPRMFAPRLAEGSVLFDFDGPGVGTYSGVSRNTIVGQWQAARFKDTPEVAILQAPTVIPVHGGGLAAKLVLTAGGLKEYRAYHLRTQYSYYDALPAQKLYSFGAAKIGREYTRLDLTAAAARRDGWLERGGARVISGKADGAFYSAVAGEDDATLKIGGLPPGFYFVTVGIGNFDGAENRFGITVNGRSFADGVSVKAGEGASLTRVVKLEKGEAELRFSGKWRISTLGFQQLMSLYEDFSFERGFWVTKGFEPGEHFRSQDYAEPPKYATGRTDFALPDPAKPMGKPKKLVYETALPSPAARAAMEWRCHAVIGEFGPANNGTFREFDAPGLVERRIKLAETDKLNVLIVSGMLSRHTFPKHQELARRMLRRFCDEAHKKKIRIIDHIDFVLLWNMDSGYRVAAEHPEWLTRELTTMLPSTDFCFNNHSRNDAFREFFKGWLRDTGIDGMMIDEANFTGANFCGCGDCRRDFTAETGLEWPVSELAPDQVDAKGKQARTPLAQVHRTWRTKRVGDWWVALRKAIEKEYPAFCFLCYTTHYGLTNGYASNQLGADLLQNGRAVDFLGTEIMSRNVWASYRSVFAYRKAQNLFHIAFGAPIFGMVYAPGGWNVAYSGWAINNMNGQITWAEPLLCPEGKGNYYLFADRNMDLAKARSDADVALLFSSQGRNNGVRMNFKQELFGIAQMLGDMHVNYDIVGDTTLSDKVLEPYKVLFVAASGPLSDAQIATIRNFAGRGGHVILGPIAAIADEYGTLRGKWPFADLFGFAPSARQSKVTQLDLDNGETLRPAQFIPAFLPDPRNRKMPPAPVTMVWGKTRIPAVFEAPYGKGKVKFMPLAVASTVAEDECTPTRPYDFAPDPANLRALEHLLRALLKDAAAGTWECHAPRQVPATLYRVDRTYYAHFFNGTGMKLRKGDAVPVGVPADGFPTPETDIEFTLPHAGLSVAEAASSDFDGWKELKLEKRANGVKVTLPKELLKVYTLVRIR